MDQYQWSLAPKTPLMVFVIIAALLVTKSLLPCKFELHMAQAMPNPT